MMVVCSMDHSPSEQISGNELEWHTTVLLVSEGADQWTVAQQIAEDLTIQSGALKKWSRTKPPQKAKFTAAMQEHLAADGMQVFAVSARAREITSSHNHYLSELGLTGHCQTFDRDGKLYTEFGPFIQQSPGELPVERRTTIPASQAGYLLHLVHFFIRTHRMHKLGTEPNAPYVDWQISADRMPGDIDGRMFLAFQALMQATGGIEGSWRFLTFRSKDPGSQLTDNIAGHLQDCLSAGQDTPLRGKRFHWEVWEEP